jgi:hypothetical protein
MTLLEIIRKNKFATATVATPATDKPVLVSSVAKVASVAVAKQESGKVVSPEDIKLEERREKVLKMLADNPGIQRAFVTDTKADSDNVIIAFAIRDVGTCELLIPQCKYDPFAVLEVIEKAAIQ